MLEVDVGPAQREQSSPAHARARGELPQGGPPVSAVELGEEGPELRRGPRRVLWLDGAGTSPREFTNGNGTKTFHRDGIRDGERTGTREGTRDGERAAMRLFERFGSRTGTQSGVQSGSIASDLSVTDKKTGQYTGWNLKGFTGTPAYTETGTPVWGEPTFGEYQFDAPQYRDWMFLGDFAFGEFTPSGDYTFEDLTGTEWGEWDALPGENPDDCLRSQNADHITQIDNVVTPGAVTDGIVTDGAITSARPPRALSSVSTTCRSRSTYGEITTGDVTNNGLAKVFATFGGVTKGL